MENEENNNTSTDLWERARTIYLSTILSEEDKGQAERYFSMISSVRMEGNTFYFKTTNAYAAELLQRDYANKLKSGFVLAGTRDDITLNFQFDATVRPQYVVTQPTLQAVPVHTQASTFISTMPLNEEYTFEEFVRGPSNSFAVAAAEGIIKHPGKTGYNPLFIHGGTGLGKTHLMQAIGNELRKTRPDMAICYLTAETFLNEYINSMKNGNLNEFRQKYRSVDLLLLDDVQFFQRGNNVQEEFFNTFNALQSQHRQIVMTSDVAPQKLPSIEARLISRFEGGSVQEIESPSYETRLAILKKKAESGDIVIADDTLEFIADNIKSHVRAMEGALAKVSVYMTARPQERLSKEILEHILKDYIEKEQTLRKITVEEIQQACAKKFGVTMEDMLSHERTQSIVTPRQLAMYIARKFTSKSLQDIATSFGKKHATILNGVKTIRERLENESDLKYDLEEILSGFGYKITDQME